MTPLKQLMLIKQANQKSVIFASIGIFKDKGFQPDVYNGCLDVLMRYIDLKDIAILNINGVGYGCIIVQFAKVML